MLELPLAGSGWVLVGCGANRSPLAQRVRTRLVLAPLTGLGLVWVIGIRTNTLALSSLEDLHSCIRTSRL